MFLVQVGPQDFSLLKVLGKGEYGKVSFFGKKTFSINFSKKKFSHAFTYSIKSIIKYIYYYIWYSIRGIFLKLSI